MWTHMHILTYKLSIIFTQILLLSTKAEIPSHLCRKVIISSLNIYFIQKFHGIKHFSVTSTGQMYLTSKFYTSAVNH